MLNLGLTAMIVGLSVGCQSLVQAPAPPAPAIAAANNSQSYTIETHGSWTKPKTTREAFNGPVPLQQVVDKSGASRRFRDLDITVIRVAKETGQILRLKAKYDPQARAVEPQYDYDILANDHVIIKAGNTSPVDELLKPLNQITGG